MGTPDVFLVRQHRIIYDIARKQVSRIVVRSVCERVVWEGLRKKCRADERFKGRL